MDTKSFHLEHQPAPEGLLTGVSSKGEFHEITQSASEVLLAGAASTGEIYLEQQCASEGLLKGVSSKGAFHEAEFARSLGVNVSLRLRIKASFII